MNAYRVAESTESLGLSFDGLVVASTDINCIKAQRTVGCEKQPDLQSRGFTESIDTIRLTIGPLFILQYHFQNRHLYITPYRRPPLPAPQPAPHRWHARRDAGGREMAV